MISDKRQKRQHIERILGYSLPFVLMVILLFFAFRNVNIGKALDLIEKTSIWWMIVFILVFLFSHLVRAYRWKVIVSSVKKDTKLLHLFGAIMVGYGVNALVPRLGEVYRALYVGKWENISRSSMFGTIVVERVLDILALGISVLISVMIYPGNLYNKISWLKSAVVLGFIIIFAMIIFLLLLVKFKQKFYSTIVKFVGKLSEKIAGKLAYIFNMLTEGFASLQGAKNYFFTILLTAAIMLIYGLTSYLGFLMLGMNKIHVVTYGTAWILMTISAFGIIIPTPGGTGSYHLIVISVLVDIFNFSRVTSSAYAILTHFISYVIFILGMVFFIHLINKRLSAAGESKVNFFNAFKTRTGMK